MKNVEIRIVGAIPDENALEEIQSIAKIFVYEQRMKQFQPVKNKKNSIGEKYINKSKKTDNCRKTVTSMLPHLWVKGLM